MFDETHGLGPQVDGPRSGLPVPESKRLGGVRGIMATLLVGLAGCVSPMMREAVPTAATKAPPKPPTKTASLTPGALRADFQAAINILLREAPKENSGHITQFVGLLEANYRFGLTFPPKDIAAAVLECLQLCKTLGASPDILLGYPKEFYLIRETLGDRLLAKTGIAMLLMASVLPREANLYPSGFGPGGILAAKSFLESANGKVFTIDNLYRYPIACGYKAILDYLAAGISPDEVWEYYAAFPKLAVVEACEEHKLAALLSLGVSPEDLKHYVESLPEMAKENPHGLADLALLDIPIDRTKEYLACSKFFETERSAGTLISRLLLAGVSANDFREALDAYREVLQEMGIDLSMEKTSILGPSNILAISLAIERGIPVQFVAEALRELDAAGTEVTYLTPSTILDIANKYMVTQLTEEQLRILKERYGIGPDFLYRCDSHLLAQQAAYQTTPGIWKLDEDRSIAILFLTRKDYTGAFNFILGLTRSLQAAGMQCLVYEISDKDGFSKATACVGGLPLEVRIGFVCLGAHGNKDGLCYGPGPEGTLTSDDQVLFDNLMKVLARRTSKDVPIVSASCLTGEERGVMWKIAKGSRESGVPTPKIFAPKNSTYIGTGAGPFVVVFLTGATKRY